jgi:hypothetical protein
MTNAVDGEGLVLSTAAAALAGVRRFILVSAFPEAARGKQVSDYLRKLHGSEKAR